MNILMDYYIKVILLYLNSTIAIVTLKFLFMKISWFFEIVPIYHHENRVILKLVVEKISPTYYDIL